MLPCIFDHLLRKINKKIKKRKKKSTLSPNYEKKRVNPNYTILTIDPNEEKIFELLRRLPSTSNFFVFDYWTIEDNFETCCRNQLSQFTCYCNSIVSRIGDSLNFACVDNGHYRNVMFSINYLIDQKLFDKVVKPKTGKNIVIYKVKLLTNLNLSNKILFQFQDQVISGSLPCPKEEAAYLASIQLSVEEQWPSNKRTQTIRRHLLKGQFGE